MKKIYFLFLTLSIVIFLFTGCMTLDLDSDSSNAAGSVNKSNSSINSGQIDAQALLNKLENYEYYENQLIVGYTSEEALEELKTYLKATKVDMFEFEEDKKVALLRTNNSVEESLLKLKTYNNYEGIRYIEPSMVRYLPDYEIIGENNDLKIDQGGSLYGLGDPLNPYWEKQWGLEKVRAQDAWQEVTGKDIVVAIIDSGVDASHKDFDGSFVDGYDPYTGRVIKAGTSKAYDSHGTHVAGIVAANKDDHYGIAGLAPDALIMPIPIFQPSYIGDFYVARGIKWAVDNGADILQNSWGGPGFSNVLKDAFDYALQNDVVVVVSTGNTHIDENWGFPNTIPGVIGVGSTNVNDKISSFSSRGDSVSVVAPGEKILSTVPGNDWAYMQGTSMASPFVSALAALLLEKYPDATPYQIRKMIENSAVDVDGIDGFSTNDGYGRIDAAAAISQQLPENDGAKFVIHFVDSQAMYSIPNVYVSLIRENGPNYYARSLSDGKVAFYQIDPGVYDIVIGGPDYLDPYSPNYRMEEQVSLTFNNYYIPDGERTAIQELESTFSATFEEPLGEGEYKIIIQDVNSDNKTEYALNEKLLIQKPDYLQFYIMAEVDPPLDFPEPIESYDFEDGSLEGWDLGGDLDPYVEDGYVVLGGEDLEDDQSSILSKDFQLPENNYGYKLNFDLRVSSEEGWDYFNLYIDENLVYRDSGEKDWYTVSVSIPDGKHTVTFAYEKDAAVSEGEDAAYIDNVEIVPIPDDYMDYVVNCTININNNLIEITHSLYDGKIIDGIDGIDAWFTAF